MLWESIKQGFMLLWIKGLGVPGGHKSKHKPEKHPCSKEGHQASRLQYAEYQAQGSGT